MKSSLVIEQIPVGRYRNFSYLVGDLASLDAAIFDPAWEVQKLLTMLQVRKFFLRYIINTHAHFDHIEGNLMLSQSTGARIVMSTKSLARKDVGVQDGEELRTGDLKFRFLHTPGHSPESMCVIVNDVALMTGDTLFIGECGRVDTPGGNAEELFDSFEKIKVLEPSLIVYPGHDYGPTPSSTLRAELETNYTLAKRSREEFVKFMRVP